jgi:hypothetical protein
MAHAVIYRPGMTQKNVEIVIGRLVTDSDFRRRLERDPAAVLAELRTSGVELNRVETEELLSLDTQKFEALEPAVGARFQRAGFSPDPDDEENWRSS